MPARRLPYWRFRPFGRTQWTDLAAANIPEHERGLEIEGLALPTFGFTDPPSMYTPTDDEIELIRARYPLNFELAPDWDRIRADLIASKDVASTDVEALTVTDLLAILSRTRSTPGVSAVDESSI